MAKRLRLIIAANVDADPEMDVKITPVAMDITDALASELERVIAAGDTLDAEPGNGELNAAGTIRVPLIKIFGMSFAKHIPYQVTLQVVDVPAEDGEVAPVPV